MLVGRGRQVLLAHLDDTRMPVESWLRNPGHLFIVLFKYFPLDVLERARTKVCVQERQRHRDRDAWRNTHRDRGRQRQ